mgnify:FL=1
MADRWSWASEYSQYEALGKITGANYHHIHFPMWEEVEIEARICPPFLSSPIRNTNLYKFCEKY